MAYIYFCDGRNVKDDIPILVSPVDALVVWGGGKESNTDSSNERWLGNYPPI